MPSVEAWFDPGCPFSWVTSRWLESVAETRGFTVRWRSFSLLLKDPDGHGGAKWEFTSSLLRVVEAVREAHGDEPIGRFYAELGRRLYTEKTMPFPPIEALAAIGLDPAFALAVEEEAWDDVIRESMEEALVLAGEDVGTPVLSVDGVGFFGPVLGRVPDRDEGGRLWDGLLAMASVGCFAELKRPRCALELP